jgi:ABC-type bacteriocin/lantibiotic exporter with double-glycine peptidase domain
MLLINNVNIIPKEYHNKINWLIIISLITSILETIGIGIIPALIIFLSDPNIIITKLNNYNLGDIYIDIGYKNFLLIFIIFTVLFFFIKNSFLIFFNFYETNFFKTIKSYYSNLLLKFYFSEKYIYGIRNNPIILSRNIISETSNTCFYIRAKILLFKEFLTFFLIFLLLLVAKPMITLITFSFFLTLIYLLRFISKKYLTNKGLLIQKYRGAKGGLLHSILNSWKEIFLIKKTHFFINKFNKLNELDLNTSRSIELITKSPRAILEFFIILIVCFSIIIFFLFFFDKKNIITPTLLLFGVAIARLYPCFSNISQFINILSTNLASYRLIEKEIKNITTTENNKKFINKKEFIFQKIIKFDNVSFKFKNEDIRPLKSVNLSIKKGEVVAIMGASGSGKSTLLQLILGFLNPTKGSIKIDNVNLREIKDSWQKYIGYVPQNIYLLDENIATNIALGVPKNKINFKKIRKILKILNLGKYIKNLDNKFSKNIEYNSANISGGEKQRIALARALYNDSKVLVFDEITSALDNITSIKIMKEFLKIKKNKTIIIVTHDTSIAKLCQKTFFLENGYLSLLKKNI